jgi:hypothetical protein
MPNFVENPSDVIAAARKNSVSAGQTIRFPVSEDIPYVMLMNFKEYNFNNVINDVEKYTQTINIGTVVLPLPLQLRDSVGIEASSAQGDIAAILKSATNIEGYQTGDSILANGRFYASVIQKALGAGAFAAGETRTPAGSIISGILAGAATAAGVGVGTTGSLLSGKAINPFETMEFKGVKLKSHSFSWRLSPSSSRDSDALRDLIKEIKKNMLPAYVGAAGPAALAHALLQYPKLAHISFLGINQDYYYRLKPCMITGFEVRYNGGEQLNVFKGGKPVVVELALELTEVQIHTTEDYGGGSINVDASDLVGADITDIYTPNDTGGIVITPETQPFGS